MSVFIAVVDVSNCPNKKGFHEIGGFSFKFLNKENKKNVDRQNFFSEFVSKLISQKLL